MIQKRCKSCNKSVFFFEDATAITCTCGAIHDIRQRLNTYELIWTNIPKTPQKQIKRTQIPWVRELGYIEDEYCHYEPVDEPKYKQGKRTKALVDEVVLRYKRGETWANISARTGTSQTTVHRILKAHGLCRARSHIEARNATNNTELITEYSQA